MPQPSEPCQNSVLARLRRTRITRTVFRDPPLGAERKQSAIGAARMQLPLSGFVLEVPAAAAEVCPVNVADMSPRVGKRR